ncbi:MAG: hypothetical protein ACOCR1_04640, partial [Planctomycetota bacterium]
MFRGLMIFITFGVVAGVGQGAEETSNEVLWKVYTQGSEAKQELLRESKQRLDNIESRAEHIIQKGNMEVDGDFCWLVQHRIPAGLVVERALRQNPGGAYLKVLLGLARHVGDSAMYAHLPELLRSVPDVSSKIAVIRTMTGIGSDDLMEEVEVYLRKNYEEADERLTVAAALGLSRAQEEAYLELLKTIAQHVERPMSQVKMAVAQHRCGDAIMEEKLVDYTKSPDVSPRIRRWIMSYLSQNPSDRGVLALGHVAKNTDDEKTVESALRSLFRVRRHIAQPGRSNIDRDVKQRGSDDTTDIPMSLQEMRQMYPGKTVGEMRESIVKSITEMWMRRDRNRVPEKSV